MVLIHVGKKLKLLSSKYFSILLHSILLYWLSLIQKAFHGAFLPIYLSSIVIGSYLSIWCFTSLLLHSIHLLSKAVINSISPSLSLLLLCRLYMDVLICVRVAILKVVHLYLSLFYTSWEPICIVSQNNSIKSIKRHGYFSLSCWFHYLAFWLLSNYMLYEFLSSLAWKFSSPIVIAAAACLLLLFSKINIGYNRFINWIAASSFAAFLIHCFPPVYQECFSPLVRTIYQHFTYPIAIFILIGLTLVLYVLCILIDQIRIRIYSIIK